MSGISAERLAELIEQMEFMPTYVLSFNDVEDAKAALRELQQLRKLMPGGKCPECHYPIGFFVSQQP